MLKRIAVVLAALAAALVAGAAPAQAGPVCSVIEGRPLYGDCGDGHEWI